MQFEYFRFLLTPVRDEPLPYFKKMTREELIESIFSEDKRYHFKSGRATYGFAIKYKIGKLIQARIGKLTTVRLHSSPDDGFIEKKEEDWPGRELFINLDDEKQTGESKTYGQIMAFEVNRSIPNSTNCLKALTDVINKGIALHGYFITINPILTPKKHFWSVVDEYEGKIKKVVLTYTPPNLFNLQNSLEDDLRNANKDFNTTTTQIVLENESGHLELPKNNQLLQQSAEYINLGNGSYSIHVKDGKSKIIKSAAGIRTETFEGIELSIKTKNANEATDFIKLLMQSILQKKND